MQTCFGEFTFNSTHVQLNSAERDFDIAYLEMPTVPFLPYLFRFFCYEYGQYVFCYVFF